MAYSCEGRDNITGIDKNTAFVSIAGGTSEKKVVFVTTKYTHPALADNANGTYDVRIAGTTQTVKLTKDQYTPVINIADDITMTVLVNEKGVDTAAMEAEFVANYVTVVKPADAQVSVAFNIEEGTAAVTYAGTEQYKGFDKTVTVNYIDNRSEVVVATPDESGVYSAGIRYNEDMTWNYDATRQSIIDAVLVESGLSAEDVTVTYEASYKPVIGAEKHELVPLEGKDAGLLEKYPAIGEGVSTVNLKYAGGKDVKAFNLTVKVDLQDGRIQTVIVLKEGASIVYNKDASVMKNDIFNNAIDWKASVLPEGVTVDDLKIEYYTTGTAGLLKEETWFDVAGGTYYKSIDIAKINPYTVKQIGAGEDQQIRISYAGTCEYKSAVTEGTLTVEKAPVKVSVHSATIYPDQAIPEGFVTTDPEDDFQIWTVYAGITSNVTTIVYVQLPDGLLNDKAMAAIDAAYELVYHEKFSDKLQQGMTVGELREILANLAGIADKITDSPLISGGLELAGINMDSINAVLDILQNLPGILDNVTVAIGTPNRAGLYLATAVATNENYETGVGTGVLIVKMRMFGVSLAWAQSFDGALTVSEAAAADFNAVVMYDGEVVKNPGKLNYLYTGISNGRLYSSHDAPTAPGKYIVTASVSGGNYFALPITRTFTIVADPVVDVTPEV